MGDSIEIDFDARNYVKDAYADVNIFYSLDKGKLFRECFFVTGDVGNCIIKQHNKIIWYYKHEVKELKGDILFSVIVTNQEQLKKTRHCFSFGYLFPHVISRSSDELFKANGGFSARFGLQGKRGWGGFIGLTDQVYNLQYTKNDSLPPNALFSNSINMMGYFIGADYLFLREGNLLLRINVGLGGEKNTNLFLGISDFGLNMGLSATLKHINFLIELQQRNEGVSYNYVYNGHPFNYYDPNQDFRMIKLNIGFGYTF